MLSQLSSGIPLMSQLSDGIPLNPMPQPTTERDSSLPHAPIRNPNLSLANKKVRNIFVK